MPSSSSSSSCSSSCSSSSNSAIPEKQVLIKLYDKNNVYIRNLNEAILDYSIEKSLFGGSGPVNIILKDKIDELEPDIQFNNKIKIYSRNKWSSTPVLIYYGYITSIDPIVRDGEQQTSITCLGAISKLQNDYLRTGTDLAYELGPLDIDDHIKTILDHYRDSINTQYSSYASSMIAATTYFPSGGAPDANIVADTSGIGTIPYRYFNLKHLGSIREIGKFLPKNDYGNAFWYWYLNDDGKFYLKKLSTTADHTLQLNKHIVSLNLRKNIEGVTNKVFFWNEKGMEGEMVKTVYDDTNSQANFDIIADRVTDSQVSTYLQARLLAEGKKDENKDVVVEATAIVSEANYNILDFKLGEVIDILDTKDPTILRKLILSGTATGGSTTTCVDTARIEAADYWNDYYIKFITGDNAGEIREITDFNHTTDTIYFRILDNAVANTDKYEIYAKTTRLIIEKIILTSRQVVLELTTPRPDLTGQVETDREYVDKQLKWFGNVVTKIDGTRISSGVQHWLSDNIAFTHNVGSPNDTVDWATCTFYLPNDVRRVISSGTSSAMVVTDPITKYYFFIDEVTCYYTDSPIVSDNGTVREGETFLSDAGKSWTTDQWKGYVLNINIGGGVEKQHIITRNTATFLYIEAHDPFDVSGVQGYEIHKFQLRETNDRGTGSLLFNGSATDADGTTTTLDDSTLTQANDFWNGYEIKFLSGDNVSLQRTIVDFDATNDRLTFDSALPNAVTNGDSYQLYINSATRIIIMASEGFATEKAKLDSQTPSGSSDESNRGGQRGFDGLNVSSYVQKIIKGSVLPVSVTDNPDTGLNATQDYFGYYDGTSPYNVSGWTVYIKNDGDFYFAGDGTNYIQWDGANLRVRGILVADDIVAGGTITGSTFQTAATGYRVKIAGSGDEIQFLYDDTLYGKIDLWHDDPHAGRGLDVATGNTTDGGILNLWHSAGAGADNYGATLNLYKDSSGGAFGIMINSVWGAAAISEWDFRPGTTATYDLGSATYKWVDLYLSGTLYNGDVGNTFKPDTNATYQLGLYNKQWTFGHFTTAVVLDYETDSDIGSIKDDNTYTVKFRFLANDGNIVSYQTIRPVSDANHDIGTNAVRYANGYFDNLYCTNQTADQHITGDIKFRHEGDVVFRIDENPEFLNFYNKDDKLIMKLDKDGGLHVKKIIEDM